MKETPSRGRLVAAFAAVYVIWGSTYLAIRYGVETLPPFLMAGVRFFTAGAILYAWERLRGAAAPTAAEWKGAFVVGAAFFLVGNGLVTWAELTIPSGATALMVASVPLFMAVLQTVTQRDYRPGLSAWAGVLLGFAGVAVLAGVGAGRADRMDPLGVAVLAVAALSWAAGSLYSRKAALPKRTLLSVSAQMLCGGACLLLAGFLRGEAAHFSIGAVSARSLWALAYLVWVGALVGFTAYAWLLQVASPVAVSSYAYVNPVVAVLLGCLFGGEVLTARVLAAGAAIIGGVVLMLRPRRL